jgi:AmmeMemoRadiSam system protein B/AmmeMemoRadiSam system protein A
MRLISAVSVVLAVAAGLSCLAAAPAEEIRQPAVAGSFYPQDPKELAAGIDGMIARAIVPAIQDHIVALIAPHAGYPYSGAVAAHSYALLKGQKIHRVVVIAPSHFEEFPFSAVYGGDAYVTPLGKVPVDKVFAGKLASMSPLIKLSSRGHVPAQGQTEHSLEVELPFLQRTLSDFELVPVVMGEQSYEASRALGVALAELIQGSDTLIVASSDLSHYHPYDEASTLDHKTLNAIGDWDYLTLSKNFQARIWEACGGAPIVAAMIAAERLGATRAQVLKYANSGDVTGDRSRVVGYGAVALLQAGNQRAAEEPRFSLSRAEKQQLLDIAKRAVETAVKENKLFEVPKDLSEPLMQDRGAFVTIRKKGDLRGCIGYTGSVKPLALTVREVAILAALRDTRFPPVTASELPQLQYEVSVLSPMRRILDTKQIRVGEYGLLMKNGSYEGILLPQVATEQGWDRKTLLEQTAVKAGLPANAWRDKDTDIFFFTALVFGEPAAPAVTPEGPLSQRPTNRPGDRVPSLPPR